EVVGEHAVATRHEPFGARLLQDARDPLVRQVERVPAHDRAVDAHECDRRFRTDEERAFDGDVLRFKALRPRTEVLQSGRAAEVHGALSGVHEAATADVHVARAALQLHAVRRRFVFAIDEGAAFDGTAAAADHVDGGTAAAPAFDAAALE